MAAGPSLGPSGSSPAKKSFDAISRREIEALIADGRHIIIVDQYVLKVDAWLPYHPGGDKAIKHMVGRDATDEVNVLHSPEARRAMDRYRIGRIEGRWENFVPPIQGGVYRTLPAALDSELQDAILQDQDAEDSGHDSSRSSSPPAVFDETGIRARRSAPRSDSNSSVSSVDDGRDWDGASFLDAVTKKEISLDLDKYPPLDAATQGVVVQKYRQLGERIRAEGLYKCNYDAYAWEGLRYCTLFCLMLLFLRWKWYAASGLCMGAFWHQLAFTAHDAGHMGITHHFHADTVIGIIIANFLGGLSIGWWKRNHNTHHIVTNSPEHDPDIEHMPFFAISHRFLGSLRSSYYDRVMKYDAFARAALSVQSWSYYLLMTLGRFNLYFRSWEYLLLGQAPSRGPAWWHRWLEIVGMVVFWTWFGYGIVYRSIDSNWGRFVFFMVSHLITAPLHVQITLSHFTMSTADLGPDESFPQKMLRTTMDVECPQWLDFFHGGLQFQAVHHLYPRIPRHNLRRTQKLVQQFCDETSIPYALYGFVDGNKQVIGKLAEVSRQAAILAKCQKALVAGGDPFHGHH